MKKVGILIAAVVVLMAVGTAAVYASTDEEAVPQQLLPLMKQMHPDSSDQQLQEMYNDCSYKENGRSDMMRGVEKGMMGEMMKSST